MLIPATNRKTHLPAPAYAWAIICIPLNCMKKGWPGSSENPSAFIILPNRRPALSKASQFGHTAKFPPKSAQHTH